MIVKDSKIFLQQILSLVYHLLHGFKVVFSLIFLKPPDKVIPASKKRRYWASARVLRTSTRLLTISRTSASTQVYFEPTHNIRHDNDATYTFDRPTVLWNVFLCSSKWTLRREETMWKKMWFRNGEENYILAVHSWIALVLNSAEYFQVY